MVRGRVEVPSRYDRMAKGAGAVRGVACDRRDVINPNPTRLRGRVDGPVPTNRRPAGYLLPGTPSTRRCTINSYTTTKSNTVAPVPAALASLDARRCSPARRLRRRMTEYNRELLRQGLGLCSRRHSATRRRRRRAGSRRRASRLARAAGTGATGFDCCNY